MSEIVWIYIDIENVCHHYVDYAVSDKVFATHPILKCMNDTYAIQLTETQNNCITYISKHFVTIRKYGKIIGQEKLSKTT